MMRLGAGLHGRCLGRCIGLHQRRWHSSSRGVRAHAWEDQYGDTLAMPPDPFQEEDPLKVAMRAIFDMSDDEDEASDSEDEDTHDPDREDANRLLAMIEDERQLMLGHGLNVDSVFRTKSVTYGMGQYVADDEEAADEQWTENWEQQFRETPGNEDSTRQMKPNRLEANWWSEPEPAEDMAMVIDQTSHGVDRARIQERALELHHYHSVNAFNEFDYSNKLAIWLQYIESFDAELDRSPHRSVQKAMRPDLPDWVRAQFYVNDGFDQWNENKRLGALEEAEWGRTHMKRTQWSGVKEELTDLLIHKADYKHWQDAHKEPLSVDKDPQPHAAHNDVADGMGENLDEFMNIDAFADLLPAGHQSRKQLESSAMPEGVDRT